MLSDRGGAAARAAAVVPQELAGARPGAASDKRGQEPFVELPWDEALDLSPTSSSA